MEGDPMGLEAVTERGRELRTLSEAEWPFAAAKLGEALESELSNHQTLLTVAARLCRLARDLEVDAVVGASAVGDQLAGAVVAGAGGSLRMWADRVDLRPTHLMVIAGVINSGAELARRLQQAESAGIASAIGVGVIGNRAAIERWRREGLHLVALEEI